VLNRGTITRLKPGKVVDTLNYDIKRLTDQGIELQPLK
jgi:hypothetical protein